MHWKVFSLAILCSCLLATWAQEDPRKEAKLITDELLAPERYDADYRPFGTNNSLPWKGPVKVQANVLVRALYDIDDNNKNFRVQLTFRQRWIDDRLVFTDKSGKIDHLQLDNTARIWKPDLFFANEIESEAHDFLSLNELARIYPNGEVLYSVRVSAQLLCAMDFKNFPFDSQKCYIKIPSYGYTTKDMMLEWVESDPVQMSKGYSTLKFTVDKFSTSYCTSKTKTGEYSCLSMGFLFRRHYAFYRVQIFIPTSIMIIVSWLTFWINRENVTARITMALIALLALASHTTYFTYSVPMVEDTKAVDMWMGTCLTFALAALVEFVIVHFIGQRRISRRSVNSEEDNGGLMEIQDCKPQRNRLCCDFRYLLLTAEGLDLLHRLAFPALFILFNVIYWPSYAFTFSTVATEFENEVAGLPNSQIFSLNN